MNTSIRVKDFVNFQRSVAIDVKSSEDAKVVIQECRTPTTKIL